MVEYLAPGVYVEEVQSGARPIEAVGSSTVGFIGVAPNNREPVKKAIAINNWSEFVREFVEPIEKSKKAGKTTHLTDLAKAVYGFYQNCNGLCYIANINDIQISTKSRKNISIQSALDLFEEIDDIAIVAAPGFTDQLSYSSILSHCEKMMDRFGILDAPNMETKDINSLTKTIDQGGVRAPVSDNGFGAYYFPWLSINNPLQSYLKEPENGGETFVMSPPSGHIAGIYARNDFTRGVHKAPANEQVKGAFDLSLRVTKQEQAILNPASVNCIRSIPGAGIRVWGARTLASGSSPWKYINVRRLFNVIEESIAKSTMWVVFEPNDSTLWNSIKRDITAFLMRMWRQGALLGNRPEDAFFVKCDSETNTKEEIDAGRVVTLVGIAPVKPAEFVVFRIGQSAEGIQVN